jgi:phosphate:Na+ symporter
VRRWGDETWWVAVILVTLGGLAIFLLGIQRIVAGMHDLAAAGLRRQVEGATRSSWRALLTGTGVGGLSQSGTATSISALSLVSAGMMGVREAIAYSLGSQVGATLAIQLAAFRIAAFALPMVGIGYLLTRWPRGRIAGELLLGAGLLFFGLTTIVEAMGGLLETETFALVIATIERSPLAFALVGLALGTLLTSSNAATALALGLYVAGGIGLPAAIAFVAGGNAGGTVIAIVADRERGVQATRVALMHTLIKIGGALLVAFLAVPVAMLVGALGGDAARQIANAHSLFNLAVALPGTWLAGLAGRLAERALPEAERREGPRHLDPAAVGDRALALALARRETLRLSDQVLHVGEGVASALRSGGGGSGAISVRALEARRLAEAIVPYLAAIRRTHGADPRSEFLLGLLTEVVTVGDLLRQLDEREGKLRRTGVEFSRAGRSELAGAAEALLERMRHTFTALAVGDRGMAQGVIDGRPHFEALISRLRLSHLARLEARHTATRVSHTHHMEVLAMQRQIDASLTRIAGYLVRGTVRPPQLPSE